MKNLGVQIMRFSLVLILLWYGIFKFTPREAEAIVDLVENSPFFSWMYQVFSVQTSSNIIGVFEIITATIIIIGYFKPKMDFYAGIASTIIFVGTLSFLFTTPGMFKKVDWLYVPNGFIIKDLMLLGYSIYLIGISNREERRNQS
ncbi:YkgB family protein [Flavobacteriaceae bacterium]|nr:YkgB family protein [Flavobacteriaceae bacterium]